MLKTISTTSLKKHMNRKNPCDILKTANAFNVSKKIITCKKNTNV